MATAKKSSRKSASVPQVAELWPGIDAQFRLIIVAAKRSKQLQRGAKPRIEIDPQKHKPTRVALEEVVSGKVPFQIKNNDHEPVES